MSVFFLKNKNLVFSGNNMVFTLKIMLKKKQLQNDAFTLEYFNIIKHENFLRSKNFKILFFKFPQN